MAIGDAIPNLTELAGVLPDTLVSRIGDLVLILQAAGVAFILYVLFIIIRTVLNLRNIKRVKKIEEKVNIIDEKLDALLRKDKSRKKPKKK
jgi:hypothetical protein